MLDDDAGTLEMTDSNGNTVSMDSDTIKIAAGSAVKIIIDAPLIELVDGASHPLVFGDNLLQYLNQVAQIYQTHVHPGELALGVFPVTPGAAGTTVPAGDTQFAIDESDYRMKRSKTR